MRTVRIIALAVLTVGSGLALYVARAQQPGIGRAEPATATTAGSAHGTRFRETTTGIADEPIPNLPGKRLVSRVIDYPPGGGRPRTATPARLSSTHTSSRARSGARSMTGLSESTGPVRRGSRAPALITG
jgi:hypothetical protein